MKVIMKVLLLQLLLIGFGSTLKIVCYYQSWTIYYPSPALTTPEDLDPTLCTHINYGFGSIRTDGNLEVRDNTSDIEQGLYKRMIALKDKNPDLKVLLSVGGGPRTKPIYKEVVGDPAKREILVASAASFLQEHGFDGMDIDWEFPEAEDKDNFILLLRALKEDFDTRGWELSVAVPPYPQDGYDVPNLSEILSHINLMAYDMYSADNNYTGQNAPLYASSVEDDLEKSTLNVNASLTNWINAGASPEKIVLGLGFYGKSFTLADPENNGLHSPITGPGAPGQFTEESGFITYVEFCSKLDEWDCQWDDEQKVPFCTNGDQWLGTDNVVSITLKTQFIKHQNLGGAMIWSIDQDDNFGTCGDVKPLAHAVYDNLM